MRNKKIQLVREVKMTFLAAFSLLIAAGALVQVGLRLYDFQHQANMMRERYFDVQKLTIKREVERIQERIQFRVDHTTQNTQNVVKANVEKAYQIAVSIYSETKGKLPDEEIKKLIKETIRPFRYDPSGYFFITDLTGREVLFADRPEMEGKNLINMQDTEGKFVIQGMIQLVKNKGEGFYDYKWTKPGKKGNHFSKTSFVKLFKPFNWFIGSGLYLADAHDIAKKQILSQIENIKYGKNGYLFVTDWDGEVLAHGNDAGLVGKNLWDTQDKNQVYFVRDMIKASQAKEGGYIEYIWPKPDTDLPSPKVSYAAGLPDWRWTIATGLYFDDIEEEIEILKVQIKKEMITNLSIIAFISIIGIIFFFMAAGMLNEKLSYDIQLFTGFFKNVTNRNERIQVDSIRFVEFVEIANAANQLFDDRLKARKELHDEKNKLEKEKEFVEDIINSLPGIFFVMDDNLNLVKWNEKFGSIVGYESDALSKVQFKDLFTAENRVIIQSAVQDVFQYGEGEVEAAIINKVGTETPYFWSARSRVIEGKTSFFGFGIDISQRLVAERAAVELKNYLDRIINSMPSTVIGIDKTEKVIHWNQTAAQETSVDEENAIGKKIQDVYPDINRISSLVKRSLQEGNIHKNERVSFDTADGRIHKNATVFPIIDKKSSGIEGAVIRIDDITHQTRLEEMMIQSEKIISLGGLAAGMAHEINNPLAAMMMNTSVVVNRLTKVDLLANQKAAEEAGTGMSNIRDFLEKRNILKQLENIHESGVRAAEIVKNMLSFARQTDSRVSYEDAEKMLNDTIVLAEKDYALKKDYDFKKVKILREFEAGLPKVPCEYTKIQQVLLNLLKNGAEAMAESKEKTGYPENPEFIIRLKKVNKLLRIEIEDNGPGIPLEIRKRVFEPFFTTKPVGTGTGLGLSVSYFIVTNQHQGHMQVVSEAGKGARFIIDLPLEKKES